MARSLTWSPEARDDLRTLLMYVSTTWSVAVARQVKERYVRRVRLLSRFPHLGQAWPEHPKIRLLVLGSHHGAAYLVGLHTTRILRIIDLRSEREFGPDESDA